MSSSQNPSPPILFLDIDGPLIPRRAHFLPDNAAVLRGEVGRHTRGLLDEVVSVFDPVAVALVNRIAGKTGARIVAETSWMWVMEPEDVRAHMVSQGIKHRFFHADAHTPRLDTRSKAREVMAWLEDHPGTERFAILEDQDITLDAPEAGGLADHLVLVDFEVGLTLDDCRRALMLLDGHDPSISR